MSIKKFIFFDLKKIASEDAILSITWVNDFLE